MSLVRLSKDWPVLLAGAVHRGLKSHETHRIVRYIDEIVDAPGDVKVEVLTELVGALEAREKRRGEERRVFPSPEPPDPSGPATPSKPGSSR